MAAILCASLASTTDARGLLGLFADEQDAPLPLPAAAAPGPAEFNDPTRPVAWISALRNVGDPSAELYGYVTAGTRIDLGTQGEITLTWLSPCREESITGGVVTVTPAGPRVSNAPASNSRALSCQPLHRLLPGDIVAAEPEDGAINAPEPVFQWSAKPGTSARLSLMDAAAGELAEIWSATIHGSAAPYPHEAPALEENHPYLVRATLDDGSVYEARFSYDPGLRYSSAPINALVMLRAGARP